MSTRTSLDPAAEANEELARSAAWRLLAQAFADPVPGLAHELLTEDLPFALALAPTMLPPVASALRELADAFDDLDARTLEEQHRATFSHVHSADCPPFETDHTASQIWRQSQELADLAGFYRAFGVEQERERPDHVSVELEFLHLLAYKTAWAVANDEPEHARTCRDAYAAFLRDHALRWMPAFARRVSVVAHGRAVAPAARLLEAVLNAEASRLGLEIPAETLSEHAPPEELGERGLCEVEP